MKKRGVPFSENTPLPVCRPILWMGRFLFPYHVCAYFFRRSLFEHGNDVFFGDNADGTFDRFTVPEHDQCGNTGDTVLLS